MSAPHKQPQTLSEQEQHQQTSVEEIKAHLSDRLWRINNLYYIKDKQGKRVLFKLNKVQQEIYDNLWFFNIIPKARQLGMTTFFAILYFDQVLFSEYTTAGIIAHRQEDMKKIFKSKIRFAWENLHPWLKAKIGEPNTDSANEMSFKNGSTIFVSMSTRSGTVNFLHISEFAYVCFKYPEKAEEIVSGAINSVEAGQMVSIESTAKGREGYFYDFTMMADKAQKEKQELTPLDFKLFFFPWYTEPNYILTGKNIMINKELQDYFATLEVKHGIKLSTEQKNWYAKKQQINRGSMFQEYPSTIEEAFSSSIEGSYYSKDMARVYLDRRICRVPHDPMYKTDTWWDLGMNDDNVILFTQKVGDRINFIDLYTNNGYGLEHYYDILEQKRDRYGYRYDAHYLPHDVEVTELSSGKTRKDKLYSLGMRNMRVGKKLSITDGIDRVRSLFSRFYFDEEKCTKLHEALFNYRRDYDAKLGVWKDKPRHDENSHIADAIRLLANEWKDYVDIPEWQQKEADSQTFFG